MKAKLIKKERDKDCVALFFQEMGKACLSWKSVFEIVAFNWARSLISDDIGKYTTILTAGQGRNVKLNG